MKLTLYLLGVAGEYWLIFTFLPRLAVRDSALRQDLRGGGLDSGDRTSGLALGGAPEAETGRLVRGFWRLGNVSVSVIEIIR